MWAPKPRRRPAGDSGRAGRRHGIAGARRVFHGFEPARHPRRVACALRASLDAEQALRAKAQKLYAPIAAAVRAVAAEASVACIFAHEKALFDFDSKHITRPGNKLAAAYLFEGINRSATPDTRRSSADPRRGRPDRADVERARDSQGHGESRAGVRGQQPLRLGRRRAVADDDTSGTAALLETARILAKHPQPATIIFASFTGEEGGLLGSREFVRQAVAGKYDRRRAQQRHGRMGQRSPAR